MNFENKLEELLEEDVILPNIIEEKCNNAYALIRKLGNVKKVKSVKKKCHIALKISVSIAACFNLLVGVGIANPAFAENIPVISNIFGLFKEKVAQEKFHQDLGYIKENAKPAKQTDEDITFASSNGLNITVHDFYCDGDNLYLTMSAVNTNAEIAEMDLIQEPLGKCGSFTFNGKEIYPEQSLVFRKQDDGSYICMMTFNLRYYEEYEGNVISDEMSMAITIPELAGQNYNEGSAVSINSSKVDEQIGTTVIGGQWNFKFKVKTDTSKNDIYELNLNQNGIILQKVVRTPSNLEFDIFIPDSYNDPAVKVTDENGKKIEGISGIDFDKQNGILEAWKFAYTDTKGITISVIDKNGDDAILAEFTVPLT